MLLAYYGVLIEPGHVNIIVHPADAVKNDNFHCPGKKSFQMKKAAFC